MDYLQARTEGGRRITRELKHYSLPVILAVGYRIERAQAGVLLVTSSISRAQS
jgi:hypothetical protein